MGAIALFIAVAVIGAAVYAVRRGRAAGLQGPNDAAWEAATAGENSEAMRLVMKVARPLASTKAVDSQKSSPAWEGLRTKLLASGGKFGGDVEVFLAVQMFVLVVGVAMILFALGSGVDGMGMVAVTVLSAGIAAFPYNIIDKAAKKRTAEVAVALPEFAELMQLHLTGGMGVEKSMAETAKLVDGPVAAEVENLMRVVRANPTEAEAAYIATGERLGTPESKAFFAALAQASFGGVGVVEQLAAQSDTLREQAHQRARAQVKTLPVKLVFKFALHLLPALFVIALVPTFIGLAAM